MKELIIIRHARSLYNIKATEDLDSGLTEFGHKQAKMVGKFLNDQFVSSSWRIETSPFLRCLETAKGILEEMPCKCCTNDKLGELTVDYHNIESLKITVPRENHEEEFPGIRFMSPYLSDCKGPFSSHYTFDYAHERMEDYVKRLEFIWEKVRDRTILITHGSPALSFIRMAEGIFGSVPVWDDSVGNCSMTWIRGDRIIWRAKELHWEMEEFDGR